MSGKVKFTSANVETSKSLALSATSNELCELAHLCKEIQWAISALLETAHHPDLAVEMHVLQDIDRMQQTLIDLSKLVGEAAEILPLSLEDGLKLKETIHLESLQRRLFPNSTDQNDVDRQKDDITWF